MVIREYNALSSNFVHLPQPQNCMLQPYSLHNSILFPYVFSRIFPVCSSSVFHLGAWIRSMTLDQSFLFLRLFLQLVHIFTLTVISYCGSNIAAKKQLNRKIYDTVSFFDGFTTTEYGRTTEWFSESFVVVSVYGTDARWYSFPYNVNTIWVSPNPYLALKSVILWILSCHLLLGRKLNT